MPVPMIGEVFDLDTARARRKDLRSSHEAADVNNVEASIGTVLETLRRFGPMHDERLVAIVQGSAVYGSVPKYTESRIRTARKALEKKGLVEQTDWDVTSRGNRTAVWGVKA